MLMPSILERDLFDDFFSFPFGNVRTSDMPKNSGMMKTDIRDTDKGYLVTMDIPGVKKEDVKAELKDGYLTINAKFNSNSEEKDEEDNFIRRERHYGSCSRSFYIGDTVTQDEIKAKFENGTLKLLIPKKEEKPAVEEHQFISIE